MSLFNVFCVFLSYIELVDLASLITFGVECTLEETFFSLCNKHKKLLFLMIVQFNDGIGTRFDEKS